MKPEELQTRLDEIKSKIATQLTKAEALTQEEYDDVAKAVVAEYESAKKITLSEAQEIEASLRGGFESLRATIHEQTAAGKPSATG